MNPLIQLRKATQVFLVALACFAFSSRAEAAPVPNPPAPGVLNTRDGQSAMPFVTTGIANSAFGAFSLFSVITGNFNTAVGVAALDLNTGDSNTATGAAALLLNTTGTENTAVGTAALEFNDSGSTNTANGAFALFSNTGDANTANGAFALTNNTTGTRNTANGVNALVSNTEGSFNSANGAFALLSNTTGTHNTANSFEALQNNTSGSGNTANGAGALFSNETGDDNTANGGSALFFSTGNSNIALGALAGSNLTTGDNNIYIGNGGAAAESNTIRIGEEGTQTSTFIAGITGIPVTGTAVVVDGSGQLGVAPSSKRFKEEIKPMDNESETILALKPVTFRYKKELDPEGIPQFGLVAEEVEKVNPDLVARDDQGKVYTVRYEAVNAMLLNEFLKEHRTVQELKTTVVEQQKQIEALTAGLQKVSARLELSKSAPQTVLNNQ